MSIQHKQQITAIIVGAGHRSLIYASYAKKNPNDLKIVGVADPIELRQRQVAELYNLSKAQCFHSAEELAKQPKMADAVINGTMDHEHVSTSLPLLKAGYDILLEKPFAVNEDEMRELIRASQKYKRIIAICHVLRYAPFYIAIRQKVVDGVIGDIMNVQTKEHVSYHHMAVAYIRGKWNRKERCHSPMIMAKCCHDLDLISWMKSGVAPRSVSSFGNRMYFRSEKAPDGAGTRCLIDCPIEDKCPYSARKHYIDHPGRWVFYAWQCLEHLSEPSIEKKIEALKKPDNPYGRCVWRCDNNVVDHQSVVIEFEDGCTATHNMIGGTSRPMRSIHLVGTKGEIQGIFEESRFVIRGIDPRPGHEYSEQVVDLDITGDMTGAFGEHGGGDLMLVEDFVKVLQGEKYSISSTRIEDSVYGHLLGFSAEESRIKHSIVNITDKFNRIDISKI